MKKILTTAIEGISLFSFVGFGGEKQTQVPDFNQCVIDGTQAPQWVCDGGATMEGGLFAVGSAEPSALGISFQRQEAVAAARDDLARQIGIKVKNMFKQFQATTGIGDAQTAEKATENV